MAAKRLHRATRHDRKFVVCPTIHEDEQLISADVALMINRSQAQLARMRRLGRGPKWQRDGRYCTYRIADVVSWLNECAAAAAESNDEA